MIPSSNLSQLRHGETIAFFSNITDIFSEVNIPALKLESQYKAFNASFNVFRAQYKVERGNKITPEIVNLDNERDNLFIAIRGLLEQHAKAHPDETLRPKADALIEVIEKHGEDLYRKSYQEQTTGMNNIFATIDGNEVLAGIVDTFHLRPDYDTMKKVNAEFDAKYLEKNRAYASQPSSGLKDLRVDTEDKFDKLTQRINAHIVLADDPSNYNALAKRISQLVETYQQVAQRRLKIEKVKELNQDYKEAVA